MIFIINSISGNPLNPCNQRSIAFIALTKTKANEK